MSHVPSDIKIRPFVSTDRPGVVVLWEMVFSYTKPHQQSWRVIRDKERMDDGLFFVAVMDGRVVGTVLAGYDGVRGWLYRVAVLPTYQRRGIARALVMHATEVLEQRGCVKVNLQVKAENAVAMGFYRAMGFSEDPVVSYDCLLESKQHERCLL